MDQEFDMTIALTVAYAGAPFAGFARQPGQCTVQGEIEHALGLLLKREVSTTCAGRTDAGVHALGQVVSFDCTRAELNGRSMRSLQRSLNALTHDSISVSKVEEKPLGFSARFDAKARVYRYRLCTQVSDPVFTHEFAWHMPHDLDVQAMERAARNLIGEHDFKSFCMAASAVGKPTCRNVHRIIFFTEEIMGEPVLTIEVEGNAFLHSMVRSIVGTLVMVGRGKRQPEWTAEVLAACNRSAAGETAPACGLTFWRVIYDESQICRQSTAYSIADDDAFQAFIDFEEDEGRRAGHSKKFVIPRGNAVKSASAQRSASGGAAVSAEDHASGVPGTFKSVCQSGDGKLHMYEDADGHLVVVPSSRLA